MSHPFVFSDYYVVTVPENTGWFQTWRSMLSATSCGQSLGFSVQIAIEDFTILSGDQCPEVNRPKMSTSFCYLTLKEFLCYWWKVGQVIQPSLFGSRISCHVGQLGRSKIKFMYSATSSLCLPAENVLFKSVLLLINQFSSWCNSSQYC